MKSYNPNHGARILWNLYLEAKGTKKAGEEDVAREYAIIRVKPRLHGLRDQQIFFLSGLPGISYARAKKILRTYETPYNAILKVRRWDVDVDGIGENTLEKVLRVLFSRYQDNEE